MIKLLIFICLLTCLGCILTPTPILYEGPLFPLTLEGKNRLAFLADEEIWVPDQPLNLTCDLHKKNGKFFFRISASNEFKSLSSFTFSFIVDEKLKMVDDSTTAFLRFKNFSCDPAEIIGQSHIDLVKIDTVFNIISGFFELPKATDSCNNSVTVSKGRFDLKYTK